MNNEAAVNMELFKELAERYEAKSRAFWWELRPKHPWYRLDLQLPFTPKAEENVEKECAFYQEVLNDMKGIRDIRGAKIDREEWKNVLFFLKNHNERLAAQVESSASVLAVFSLLAAIAIVLAQTVAVQNWVIVGIVCVVAFQTFGSHVDKRHELARNKALINVLERFLEGQSSPQAVLENRE